MSTNNHDFDQLFQLMTDTRKLMVEQFNKIDERFERIDRRFESIDQRFDNVEQRLENIETNQKEHNRRIGNPIRRQPMPCTRYQKL